MLKQLHEKYDGKVVTDGLKYVLVCWGDISERMFKKSGGSPTLGFLLRFHDSILVQSQTWIEYWRLKVIVDEASRKKTKVTEAEDRAWQKVLQDARRLGIV